MSSNLAAHSQSTQDKVQQVLDSGYEVTIHEAPITQDGWSGSRFNLIDPSTGAGGYLIDGGSNGGFLNWGVKASDGVTFNGTKVGFAIAFISLIGAVASVTTSVIIMLALI